MGRENLNFRTMGARVTSPVLTFNLHEFFPRFGFLRRTFLDFPPETWGPCFRGENPAAKVPENQIFQKQISGLRNLVQMINWNQKLPLDRKIQWG